VNAEFITSLRADMQAMVRAAMKASPYGWIVARESSEQTREKHEWEREILREHEEGEEGEP
jgi:hypothetical protein